MDRDPAPGEFVWVHSELFVRKEPRLAVVVEAGATGSGDQHSALRHFSVTVFVRPDTRSHEGLVLYVDRREIEPVAPFLLGVKV